MHNANYSKRERAIMIIIENIIIIIIGSSVLKLTMLKLVKSLYVSIFLCRAQQTTVYTRNVIHTKGEKWCPYSKSSL